MPNSVQIELEHLTFKLYFATTKLRPLQINSLFPLLVSLRLVASNLFFFELYLLVTFVFFIILIFKLFFYSYCCHYRIPKLKK